MPAASSAQPPPSPADAFGIDAPAAFAHDDVGSLTCAHGSDPSDQSDHFVHAPLGRLPRALGAQRANPGIKYGVPRVMPE